MIALARRLADVKFSASAAMTAKARDIAATGARVISLAQGEPDFPTPPHAIAAAHQAALDGDTKYPSAAGSLALRQAVQRKFARENHLDYALDEIIVANGGKQIIHSALMATVDPGDEVIILAPYWVSYTDMAKIAGGLPVLIDCPQANAFKLRAAQLDAAITPRTKWLLLNSPNNPTGAAYDRTEMQAIADVLLRHPGVMVLSDDMYEHLIYDGFAFCTIAEVQPRLKDRVLTVNGVSKTYAMTGWRVGYAGGPRALIDGMVNVQSQATIGVSTISQAAAVAALNGPQDMLAERAAIYRERRDLMYALLAEAPGLVCHKPEGAFYLYPNIAACLGKTTEGGRTIENDTDFALALLEEKYVAVVQGAAYGMSPYIRISYATDTDSLREAGARLIAFCQGLWQS
jgi:aspartate aminotransferase